MQDCCTRQNEPTEYAANPPHPQILANLSGVEERQFKCSTSHSPTSPQWVCGDDNLWMFPMAMLRFVEARDEERFMFEIE